MLIVTINIVNEVAVNDVVTIELAARVNLSDINPAGAGKLYSLKL